MGLQGQVTDCSTESLPILLVAILANCFTYLRSVLDTALRSMGLSQIEPEEGLLLDGVASELAGFIILGEQKNANRIFSYEYGVDCCGESPAEAAGSDCVVCLSKLREGEMVRRLRCRHVFHKGCFDGWLDQLQFSCPLCRFPLVSDRHVGLTERRVCFDLTSFFSSRRVNFHRLPIA
ncbi:hypothetical protein Vadar_017220 [Vaccinium darrowii]|uniref:Uncharacterized protein n=1 Tax=Vaccinium darrowii TaxID=229202 RepID=A0ACB7XI38_9ERIC|nr:hypothetical protein Vadar_017220 [Vaccinium darrowii]